MNLILLEPEDLEGKDRCARLKGRRFIHVRDILKIEKGDELAVGMVNGLMGKAKVLAVSSTFVDLEPRLSVKPPVKLPITVIFALPRPPVLKRMLLTLSSLGVEDIHVIHSQRVEKSYWNSPTLEPQEVREQLILGLEQAKDTVLPKVTFHKRFKPFAEDVLPEIIAGKKAYLAHPVEKAKCPKTFLGKTVFIIGPEGGFIPYEADLMSAQRVKIISLGERIAKVETAAIMLVSRCF